MIPAPTPEELVIEIAQTRSWCLDPIVLVEGPTDSRVLERLLDRDVRILPCFGRKELQDVKWGAHNQSRLLGIYDRDQDDLLNGDVSDPDLFAWDHSDRETTILCSKAFDRYVGVACVPAMVQGFVATNSFCCLAEALLAGAAELGGLRLLSRRHGLRLNFARVRLSGCTVPGSLSFDVRQVIDEVLGSPGWMSPSASLSAGDLEAGARAEAVRHDRRRLVRGHDAIELFVCGLAGVLAVHDKPPLLEVVERRISDEFKVDDFRETLLCGALAGWESRNLGVRLLRG